VMNTNEPKGKQEDYLTGNRGIWYQMIGDGPIYREVDGYVDWWRLDVDNLSFESARFGPSNHYTTAPLVINQAQLDWPCHEGFSLQANWEHKQENGKQARHKWSEYQWSLSTRFESTSRHSRRDARTGALDHNKRTWRHSYNESRKFQLRKLQLNKTQV
jgi:hypothetical protein